MDADTTNALFSIDFLRGGGLMGELTRAFDWQRHSLGPPETWPLPLRTAVRIMLSTNHPVFIFWGEELTCLYNDAYSRSIGAEKHPSMLGMPGKLAWPEIWHIIGPQIEYVMSGRGSTWHENHLVPIDRNGNREDVYWTYSYSPIDSPDASHGVGGVLVLCTETTEQVLAAGRMRAAEERWRRLFDQAPGFMCVLSGPEHRFEFANPAYYKVIGNVSIIGKTAEEALPWAVQQGFIALLNQVYQSGEPYSALSVPLRLPSDTGEPVVRYVDFVYQPIRDEMGRITGILAQGSDVTERERAVEALQEADKRKDEFLATLAHELRNPLAPVQTGIEVLRLARGDPTALESSLTMMERQISHLVRLVDDLLDLSRISQGKINLRLETVDLSDALRKALEACRASLNLHDRQLSLELPSAPLPVNADPVRLLQVLGNLLNNAVKYTDERGHIWVKAFRDGEQAIIAIRDDGLGIEPPMLNELFHMFVQANSNRGSGLGIGLALVKSLVKLHGGEVMAHSAGLGEGSEFTVTLPLIQHEQRPSSRERSEALFLGGMKTLIVDDNVDAATSLELLLNILGANTRKAFSGKEALNQLEEFNPELILLDIGMPDMDGYAVARSIRDYDTSRKMKLAAVTGWGQEDDRQRTREAGFDFHLVKPISVRDIERLAKAITDTGQAG